MKICKHCGVEKTLDNFSLKNKDTGNRMTQCKSCRNEYSRNHAKKPEVMKVRREQKLVYWERKKEEIQPKRTVYMKRKRQVDPNARIANVMRATLNHLITGKIKSTSKNIGCDSLGLKMHLSKLFIENMSWDNYGDWELDHKVPVSAFNLQDKDEFDKCWNYTNLQPMWKSENRTKSAGVLI